MMKPPRPSQLRHCGRVKIMTNRSGVLQVPDQQCAGHCQEQQAQHGCREEPQRTGPGGHTGQNQEQRHDVRARRDRFGPRVQAEAEGRGVRERVVTRCTEIFPASMAGSDRI